MPTSSNRVPALRVVLAWLLLMVAMIGGGGGLHGGLGGWGDLVAQLVALPLLLMAIWPATDPSSSVPWRRAAWALIPLLVLVWQCLPLPASLALLSPARLALAAELAQAQVAPGWHVALSPIAVERAAWYLLPGIAIFLAALRLTPAQRARLLQGVLALALLGVVLGLMQIADGPDSALRLYRPTHAGDAVGFFANRNHQATLLVMCLPLAFAALVWTTRQFLRDNGASALDVTLWVVVAILLIVGLALARSRAGLALGMLAVLGGLALGWRLRREGHRGVGRVGAITLVLSALLVVQFGLVGILNRLALDPVDDGRWTFAEVTRVTAHEHLPWGAGLGGFVQAYGEVEGRGTPDSQYVNHAHDEYLELWLEGGPVAAVAVAVFLLLLAGASVRAWHQPWDEVGLRARAAAIAVWMPVLHSVVDYPLRSSADLTVFALLLATLLSDGAPRATTMDAPADRNDP